MRNKASRINGKRGIVRSSLASQFGNGPLPNWNLNTHPLNETFHTHGLKPTGVLI
jgi:hypothetical protein